MNAKRCDIAAASRISTGHYNRIERGNYTPPNSTLTRIISAFALGSDERNRLLELAALNRGLCKEDAGLPDEVSALIADIRRSELVMPTRFVRALRNKIREDINALALGSDDKNQLSELAPLKRGLHVEDPCSPDEVAGLIDDVRRTALVMPTQLVRYLRLIIREID